MVAELLGKIHGRLTDPKLCHIRATAHLPAVRKEREAACRDVPQRGESSQDAFQVASGRRAGIRRQRELVENMQKLRGFETCRTRRRWPRDSRWTALRSLLLTLFEGFELFDTLPGGATCPFKNDPTTKHGGFFSSLKTMSQLSTLIRSNESNPAKP